MSYRLPSLNALRAFESVARLGSLTAAAKDLNVTPSALSRHITLLEGQLGVPLLIRHGRGLSLTDRGREYHNHIALAFQNIDRAGKALRQTIVSPSTLHVSMYTTFATEWLAPRLPRFRELHPDIDLRLTVSRAQADFSNGELDVAMAATSQTPIGFIGDDLFPSCLFPVCSPELVVSGPRLDMAEDLRRFSPIYANREIHLWRSWCEGMGIAQLDLDKGLRLENLSLTYQAVRRGAGVALGQAFFVMPDLMEGRLLAPLPFALDTGVSHRLLYRENRLDAPAVKAFREWINAESSLTLDDISAFTTNFRTFHRRTTSTISF